MSLENVILENVQILYTQSSPNFSGREFRYNQAGKRNFCITLPFDIADEMGRLGWNVRMPKDPESGQKPFIQASVNYDCSPRLRPIIHMITDRADIPIHEEDVGSLDEANIVSVDVVLRDFEWEPGKHKAYVQELYVTVAENRFADKYRNRFAEPDNAPF